MPIALAALLYGGGYIAQFLYNYDVWQAAGGIFGTAPEFPDGGFLLCIAAVFRWPYGLYGVDGCVGALAVLICMVMRMGYSETGEYDRERNLIYSNKGTYGTAGFMTKKELKGVLDVVPNIRKHHGIILGEIDGEVIYVPEKTRFNGNLAVYGASGSKKTRAFCMNMILQSAARKSLLVICDPKSELYEKSSAYLRDQGYTVKVFNLATTAASDSWNCLSEIKGQELTAQLFCDVIIKNTGSDRGDHFWDSAELNLLKALVLYVERGYPPEKRNIGEVYQLLAMSSEKELNAIFDVLDISHPAKAPYSIFKQSSESVRGGVIIGLGSRLQVFQNQDIRNITGQKFMLEDYARRNGFPNPTHFTDDGISGTRFDRPGFTAMMEQVEAGNVEAIIFKDMSRLGRDYLKVGQVMEILRQRGVRLIAINDNVDTAKGDSDMTPFLNIMFEEYATGNWTIGDLADHLAASGLTTRATPKIPSAPIDRRALNTILVNPYYKGIVVYKEVAYQGSHTAIVDTDTWQRVQDVLSVHYNGERTCEHPHFLRGSLYCKNCGSRMIVTYAKSRSGIRYPYFVCTGRHNKTKDCKQKAVLIDEIEKQVEQIYDRYSFPPAVREYMENFLQEGIKAEQQNMKPSWTGCVGKKTSWSASGKNCWKRIIMTPSLSTS